MKVRYFQFAFYAFVLVLACILLSFHKVQPQPCTTDADCHARNPGLCAADEPYCFRESR